jgi:hypothetical protein
LLKFGLVTIETEGLLPLDCGDPEGALKQRAYPKVAAVLATPSNPAAFVETPISWLFQVAALDDKAAK